MGGVGRLRLRRPRAPTAIAGKTRQAFANGFLGVASFGRSTFATVGRGDAGRPRGDRAARWPRISSTALRRARARGGAAGRAGRRPRSCVELCREAPINTVFTVRRTWDAGGQIKEEFRTIRPPTGEPLHAKIWTVVDDEAVTSGNRPACTCSSAAPRAGSRSRRSSCAPTTRGPRCTRSRPRARRRCALHEDLMADPFRPVDGGRGSRRWPTRRPRTTTAGAGLPRRAGARRHHRGRLSAADAPGQASPFRRCSSTRWCT